MTQPKANDDMAANSNTEASNKANQTIEADDAVTPEATTSTDEAVGNKEVMDA